MAENLASKILNAIGTDIALLLSVIVLGVFLAIIYTGAGDTKTAEFALIFCILAFVCLVAAGIARAANKAFFFGADHAITPALSSKEKPYLGLIYLIAGVFIGIFLIIVASSGAFSFVSSEGFFSNFLQQPSSFGATGFVFQNVFSPVVEEYFFRGFLFAIFEFIIFGLLAVRMGAGMAARGVAVFLAALLQALPFAFVHIVPFGGDPSLLFSSVVFGMAMAFITRIFGILAAIGAHMGHNLGVFAAMLGIIR